MEFSIRQATAADVPAILDLLADDEIGAVTAARQARDSFATSGSSAYAWWVVREQGARLANFIADSRSEKEFVLDFRTGELVEVAR